MNIHSCNQAITMRQGGHEVPETVDAGQTPLAAARRTQILDAATSVFATRGFSRATIRDIARAAGLADGTIYI